MNIEVPFEIGDPIIIIDCNQHDGYYCEYDAFDYEHIPQIGKTVFKTYAEAKLALDKLNEKIRH